MSIKISEEQLLRRIYNQGYAAFHDGRKEEDCSYDGEKLHEWMKGFHDAEDEERDYQQSKLI